MRFFLSILNSYSYRLVYNNKLCQSFSRSFSFAGDFKIITSNILYKKFIDNLQEEFTNLHELPKLTKQDLNRIHYLKPIISIITQKNQVLANKKSLKELSDSKELQELVKEEEEQYKNELQQLEDKLVQALLVNQEYPCKGVVFEITAGVGGQEAMLFARDLYEMYCNFIEYKGWTYIIANLDSSDIGGIRHASLLIDGENVYSLLRQEAGVHRVQRVPTTDKSGRIHTSTVTVTTIPQPNEVDILIKPSDLRIETKRAGGAGGQHVNTTDSAVRIVHLPTGTVVECQTDRSQIKNREIALQKLKAQLYQTQLDEQFAASQLTRKSQVASSLRSEKIRTYNYNQQRISDHRLQGEHIFNLRVFLEGTDILENLIEKLEFAARKERLQHDIESCEK